MQPQKEYAHKTKESQKLDTPILIDWTASDGTLFELYLNGLNHQKISNGAVESI